MTDQEINVAVAVACGKHVCSHSPARWDRRGPEGDSELFCNDCGEYLHDMRIPDYCHDLNAMHEAEKRLTPTQEERYVSLLSAALMNDAYEDDPRWINSNLASSDSTYRATARQRAEAFIRVKCPEKWKD